MARQVRFDDAAEAFIAEHEGTWRSLKHAKQWRSTLAIYAFPQYRPPAGGRHLAGPRAAGAGTYLELAVCGGR